MEWKLIKDEKPPIGVGVIFSNGIMSIEGARFDDGYIRHDEYDLATVGFEPIAWCEIPKWEGEIKPIKTICTYCGYPIQECMCGKRTNPLTGVEICTTRCKDYVTGKCTSNGMAEIKLPRDCMWGR